LNAFDHLTNQNWAFIRTLALVNCIVDTSSRQWWHPICHFKLKAKELLENIELDNDKRSVFIVA